MSTISSCELNLFEAMPIKSVDEQNSINAIGIATLVGSREGKGHKVKRRAGERLTCFPYLPSLCSCQRQVVVTVPAPLIRESHPNISSTSISGMYPPFPFIQSPSLPSLTPILLPAPNKPPVT